MPSNPLDIYGSYADGYCAPLAPSAQPHFYHANGSVTLSRLPVYPDYTLLLEQATEKSAGNESMAYDPIAQELYISLSWSRMCKVDKEALENFWRSVTVGMSNQFSYNNPFLGPPLSVYFADPELPLMPEAAYQQYQVSLRLRVAINYPQLTAAGTPPALTGNRFVLGNVAMQFPTVLKGSGHGMTKLQPTARDSSGDLVTYDKSRILVQLHQLAMILTYDQFVSLQAFVFSFAHGARNVFTWVDFAETARTVRFSGTSISVKQLGFDRFQADLTLLEELPA